jgi:hypothetical protein
LPIFGFLVAVCKQTAKHNIMGASQAKDNNNNIIITLALTNLKNNNQQTMVTDHGSVEGWEWEVRGHGKGGAGGRSVTKPILSTKPVGVGRQDV